MLFYFALLISVVSFGIALDVAFGIRKMQRLKDYTNTALQLPSLSIVFAARNEERNIEQAVRSLLTIDYPQLQIIAVNDRSTDKTLEILNKIAVEHNRLKILTVNELPQGWLGKNHALYLAAQESTSELILFTDADIHFETTSLKRAVTCLIKEKADHIAIMPHMKVKGFFLNLMIGVFGSFLYTYLRPWKAQDKKSKYHVGIGAFNLMKRNIYERVGTFEAIKLRPDDDIKLGKLVKLHGFKQIVLLGDGLITVEWYRTIKEFVKGLEKNMYSGIDYRFHILVLSSISMFLNFIAPYLLLFVAEGRELPLLLSAIFFQFLTYIVVCFAQKTPLITFIAFPVGVFFYLYVFLNSTLKTIFLNGIEWRGTFYSLDELKKNKV